MPHNAGVELPVFFVFHAAEALVVPRMDCRMNPIRLHQNPMMTHHHLTSPHQRVLFSHWIVAAWAERVELADLPALAQKFFARRG